MTETNELKAPESIERVNKVIKENPDSLEVGTPAKGGAIKVYGDFSKPDEFQKKIDDAVRVREYAQAKIFVNPASNT